MSLKRFASPIVLAASIAAATSGCAAEAKELRLPRLFGGDEVAAAAAPEAPPKPALLVENHFSRDAMGTLTEDQLKEILKAPVFLEEKTRIGIVPVSDGYGADGVIP